LGIYKLPASQHAVRCQLQGGPNEVFGYIITCSWQTLPKRRFQKVISELPINKEANVDQKKLVDSNTLSLSSDVFKGAGRNPISGKKKGG